MKKLIYNPDLECERIIERIHDICKLRGISYYSLAKMAEMSSSSVYGILTGKTRPSIHTLFKLCNALEVTIDELVRVEKDNTDMTAEELCLIKQYRGFSDRDKKMFKLYMTMVEELEAAE